MNIFVPDLKRFSLWQAFHDASKLNSAPAFTALST